ncbi:DUF3025 domain-containing protein [Fluviispira multicolorata]|uniref:DUF3025 domain-containing protein n=1 Tax=Fluviispira multicolorata TaxID=2654512 RepID=A0A833JHS7_9BACT|nr:DUF3025 domain-containing protein [Fluviispira multicolorata]KAB8033542.1 DUF3025 domain-containing protein [Fluviispira multicolorata]
MAHPNESRVEKKEHIVPQLTFRSWNSQFLKCSELFFPIMPYGKVFSNFCSWPQLNDLNVHLPSFICSWSGQKINFVLQRGMRVKEGFEGLYEPRIFLLGEVRTRLENWHDFFNAQIWYSFPKTKSALNMRQFFAFDEHAEFPWCKSPPNRMREQDYMTMFDEGGCLIAKINNVKVPFIFGHAIYERMLYGQTDLSMCAITIECEVSFLNKRLKDQLKILDLKAAKILSNRNIYYENKPFFTFSIAKALSYL